MWLFWNNVYLKVSSCGKMSLNNRASEKVAYSKSSSLTVLFVTNRLTELSRMWLWANKYVAGVVISSVESIALKIKLCSFRNLCWKKVALLRN